MNKLIHESIILHDSKGNDSEIATEITRRLTQPLRVRPLIPNKLRKKREQESCYFNQFFSPNPHSFH
jgi:hypothetical protein